MRQTLPTQAKSLVDTTTAIVLGVILACLGEAGAWWQISYSQMFPKLSNSFWPLLITSPFVAYCYWKATRLIYTATGSFWDAKIVFFSTGIIVFGILTYIYFNEAVTYKTMLTVALATLIVYIQVYL